MTWRRESPQGSEKIYRIGKSIVIHGRYTTVVTLNIEVRSGDKVLEVRVRRLMGEL